MDLIFNKYATILAFIFATSFVRADPGEPLYLTPLINAGEIDKAQEAALVTHFSPVKSFSGLITVNEEHNSNIFFWFFPAEESYGEGKDLKYDENIPVILWSDGGPGVSCVFSIFDASGPFIGNPPGNNYTLNKHSWHKKYHMIYMDNPVQIGFSYTDKEEGIVSTHDAAVRDIYGFLLQFFKLFPNLQKNPFYNAGVSYGGTYAIRIANRIHEENLKSPEVKINLIGAIIDAPWIDAKYQSLYADLLYAFGVINGKEKDAMRLQEEKLQEHLVEGELEEAMAVH